MARLLSVLDINDRKGPALPPRPRYYDLRLVRNVKQVQAELLRPHRPPIDIFLIDINMDRNAHPDGLDWGAFPRYGPILALPFTFGVHWPMTFAAYSSWWGHDAVKKDGALAVALSLIMSAASRKQVSLEEVRDHLGKISADAPSREDPTVALRTAVSQLRKSITDDADIGLRDIVATREKLNGLRNGNGVAALDALFNARLAVGIYFRGGSNWLGKDIQLESLFMDVLDFGAKWNIATLELIDTNLRQWEARSEDFAVVRGAMEFFREARSPRDIQAAWGSADLETRRLIILFAWIRACARHEPGLQSVRSALGLAHLPDAADGYRTRCDDAKLPELVEDSDVELTQRDWAFCRYYAHTLDSAGRGPRPSWMVDPDTPRGNRAWDRLMEMASLFSGEDDGCVCDTMRRANISSNTTRRYRFAHKGVCDSCRYDQNRQCIVREEEDLRLAHLFSVHTDGRGTDDWSGTAEWKRCMFRKLCGRFRQSVFECIKMSVHSSYCSLETPSLAAILTLMSMLPGRISIEFVDYKLDLRANLAGLPQSWLRSLGGIVALARCDLKHTSPNSASHEWIRVELIDGAIRFLTGNALGGRYSDICCKAADPSRSSDRARQLRDVYMVSESQYDQIGPGVTIDKVSISETPAGLEIQWSGARTRSCTIF